MESLTGRCSFLFCYIQYHLAPVSIDKYKWNHLVGGIKIRFIAKQYIKECNWWIVTLIGNSRNWINTSETALLLKKEDMQGALGNWQQNMNTKKKKGISRK